MYVNTLIVCADRFDRSESGNNILTRLAHLGETHLRRVTIAEVEEGRLAGAYAKRWLATPKAEGLLTEEQRSLLDVLVVGS